MTGIPTGRTESGPQIDQRITRQLLFTKRLCFRQYLLAARQCSMRLLISQRPNWWHVRIAGKPRPFTHQLCGSVAEHQKNIHASRTFRRAKETSLSCEIKASPGIMEEQT